MAYWFRATRETLIFLLTSGSDLRIFNDHRSINSFEGVSDRRALFTSAQPVCFGSIRDSGKGNGDAFRALEDVTGAELKWLDPH